jgi:heme-degrading monooxygenase HmoA
MSDLFDWNHHPELVVRIDSFTLPEAARAEFTATMHRNLAFIRTLEGFRGHRVFEKRAGDSAYNIVTLAAWESPAALERAGKEVRTHYQRQGFDMPATLKRWGAQLVRADYGTPADLQ